MLATVSSPQRTVWRKDDEEPAVSMAEVAKEREK